MSLDASFRLCNIEEPALLPAVLSRKEGFGFFLPLPESEPGVCFSAGSLKMSFQSTEERRIIESQNVWVGRDHKAHRTVERLALDWNGP